jgi:aspartyl-tRNA(Asn)/glutamyl-tRNA(Gln) amidotransferase subunit A
VDDLVSLSALELRSGFAAQAFSPVDVVEALGRRIEAVEPRLKAFLTLTLDEARVAAAAAERAYASGEARALEGVPIAVKDLYDTAGVRTTYGSPMFAGHVPAADATAVKRVKDAGAIVLGKTSTHEFAWGVSSYNAHFDSGRNAWDPERVSGGSSGGSAVALAAHEAPLALGSDTGGSIRVPASFSGVVGFKPTFGQVPRDGLLPLAPSLDHAGPLARTPADATLLYSVLAGRPLALRPTVAGLRMGVAPALLSPEPEPVVRDAFDSALRVLRELGADVVEVELPDAKEILRVFAVVQAVEALGVHRQRGLWPTRRDEYGVDVRGRLEGAEERTLDEYVAAAAEREQIRGSFVRAFADADLIVSPVSAVSPSRFGEEDVDYDGSRRPFRALVLPYSTPQDVVGIPSCTVRAGFDELGIPVGVQLAGPPGADALVLGAAQAFFEATPGLQADWPA